MIVAGQQPGMAAAEIRGAGMEDGMAAPGLANRRRALFLPARRQQRLAQELRADAVARVPGAEVTLSWQPGDSMVFPE